MSVLETLLVVALAGAVGGILAALLSDDKGFVFPRPVRGENGTVTYRPGFLGLILVGACAAALSFALYGPLAGATVIGGPGSPVDDSGNPYGLTLAALAGAVLIGTGGSKWLASQVDKVTLQQTAVTAARREPDLVHARQIAEATPSQALETALDMTQTATDQETTQRRSPDPVAGQQPNASQRSFALLRQTLRRRRLG